MAVGEESARCRSQSAISCRFRCGVNRGDGRGTLVGRDGFRWQRTSGIFNFNGQYTKNAYADFLLGTASSASLSNWSYLALRTPYSHFFVQDDWKITPRVT